MPSERTNQGTRIGAAALVVLSAGLLLAYTNSPQLQRAFRVVFYRVYPTTIAFARHNLTVELDVPFHRQEHALSCEIATLKMVLDYLGTPVTESELLGQLPFAARGPRQAGNVWGDPDVGFVGDIDGSFPNTGYGVYEQPMAALAQQYREAKPLSGATLTEILREVENKRPVIVWGAIGSGRDISWTTPEGKYVKAVSGEHTRVIVGFSGTVENPIRILLLDPIYGRITMPAPKFLVNWGLLGNRAVVVY